MVYYALEKYLQ